MSFSFTRIARRDFASENGLKKKSAIIFKISIDPFSDFDMFVLPPETGGDGAVETSVSPAARFGLSSKSVA